VQKVVVTTWAELKTQCEAGGKEVVLSDSFVPGDYPGEIFLNMGICTIRGAGQVLDANSAGRHFRVQSFTALEVHGLTLKNGWGEGGAIYVNGGALIKLTQITFEGNLAKDGDGTGKGGAIYAHYEDSTPTFEISDCQFTSNSGYEVNRSAAVSMSSSP
jgi:predicted outer membrane repeat protein